LVSLAAFWLSSVASGLPAAVAYLVAAAAVPVTLGIAISGAVQQRSYDRGHSAVSWWRGMARFRKANVGDLTRCTGCGSSRQVSNAVLVCARCDLAPTAN
jgi:hypothetical protein